MNREAFMKRFLVISDIHGDAAGAAVMEEALERHGLKEILCLGDILYHGPRNDLPAGYAPKEVIPVMNRHSEEITAVRGNCDAEVDQMVLDFPITADYSIFFLENRRVFMTHGHVSTPDHMPRLKKSDIFLSGHTHVPTAFAGGGIYMLNPGSVSLPKNGHPKTYAILDEEGFTVYTEKHEEYMSVRFE